MKKFVTISFSILSFFLMNACKHYDQKVVLNLDFKGESTSVGNGKELQISVIDEREKKEVIGKKEFFWDKKVVITTDQNLPQFVKEKIAVGLGKKGFKVAQKEEKISTKSDVKSVSIRVKTLKFKSENGFPVGKAKFIGELIVAVKSPGKEFSKSYEFISKRKYFISSSEADDAGMINCALRDIIEGVVNDEILIQNLS